MGGSGAAYTGLGGCQSQGFVGGNDSVRPPKLLTPLMMCWGGILTTTRRVTSSFGPQVLMPSMGDRSGGGEQECWFGGHPRLSYTFLPLPFPQSLYLAQRSTRSPSPKSDKGFRSTAILRVSGRWPRLAAAPVPPDPGSCAGVSEGGSSDPGSCARVSEGGSSDPGSCAGVSEGDPFLLFTRPGPSPQQVPVSVRLGLKEWVSARPKERRGEGRAEDPGICPGAEPAEGPGATFSRSFSAFSRSTSNCGENRRVWSLGRRVLQTRPAVHRSRSQGPTSLPILQPRASPYPRPVLHPAAIPASRPVPRPRPS